MCSPFWKRLRNMFLMVQRLLMISGERYDVETLLIGCGIVLVMDPYSYALSREFTPMSVVVYNERSPGYSGVVHSFSDSDLYGINNTNEISCTYGSVTMKYENNKCVFPLLLTHYTNSGCS